MVVGPGRAPKPHETITHKQDTSFDVACVRVKEFTRQQDLPFIHAFFDTVHTPALPFFMITAWARRLNSALRPPLRSAGPCSWSKLPAVPCIQHKIACSALTQQPSVLRPRPIHIALRHASTTSGGLLPKQLTERIKKASSAQDLLRLHDVHGNAFNDIHISATWVRLRGLSKGEGMPLDRLCSQTVQMAGERLLGGRQLANIAHAAAKLRLRRRAAAPLFNALASASTKRVGDFNPQNLSNTAWAFAKAGHAAPKLFDALASASATSIRRTSPTRPDGRLRQRITRHRSCLMRWRRRRRSVWTTSIRRNSPTRPGRLRQ